MEFLYTVQASDMDDDGISISANALTLNGGTIASRGTSVLRQRTPTLSTRWMAALTPRRR